MNIVNVGYDSTNYYVIEGWQGTRLLVDVGFPGTLPKLQAALKRKSLAVGDLRAVVATHYHPDHAGLLQELKIAGVQHLILAPQLPAIAQLQQYLNPKNRYVAITTADAVVLPLAQGRTWLAGLGIPGQFLATPGHSPDSVSLVLDSGEAFTGDLTWPALAREEDQATIAASWASLRARGARTVYPGHGPQRPMP